MKTFANYGVKIKYNRVKIDAYFFERVLSLRLCYKNDQKSFWHVLEVTVLKENVCAATCFISD